jgi:Acetyltransferase (GNAT) domain
MLGGQTGTCSNPALADSGQRWRKENTRLQFVFAGKALSAVYLPALVLDAPFNQASSNPSKVPAPPQSFPEGIEATRMYSCPLDVRARTIALQDGAIRYIPAQYDHLYVDLRGSFEDYLQKFSSKTRWTLRKKLKRFKEGCTEEPFREYSDASEMPEFYALSRTVSKKTYQQRLLDAGIPQGTEFPLELNMRAARGEVQGYVLTRSTLPVAYALCYVRGDTVTLDKMGFDPKYADMHPGTVLTYLIIERLFAQRCFRVFDFGSGYFEYKAFFSTHSVRCAEIIYLRRNLRNFTLVLTHAALNAVSRTLKRVLDVLGLKARIIKWIHQKSSRQDDSPPGEKRGVS